MNTIEKKLADGLKEAGKKNLALSSVVPKISDDVQRDMSMENVAKPIAEAIFDGEARVFRVSVNDVNSMQDVCADILYILDDSGIIGGNPPLSVNAGDVVVFNGLSWQKIGGGGAGPAIDAYTKSETDNRISEGILAHNALSDSHADIRHSITAEATARAAADTSLGGRIDDAEEAIGNEADERAESDRDLQSQIDAITSKSDVVDVVASYVELVAYDTSVLGDNDVVKVLEDEMHDNAESYYRWDITTETWGYIGSQGPFVTPAEMQTALGGKVDKVTGKGLSTNDFDASAKSVTDNIFLATYGSTSYADIKAAYDAGKTILCRFTDSSHTVRVATFDRLTNSTTSTSYAYFASVTKTDAYELVASKTRYGTTTTWSNTHKTWGALAEKDSVTNADISGTIQDAHISSASTWNGKQDAISDLSTIISNASNGQTSYGWGNHATWTPTFSQALSRTNLNGSGETIATIFGKIKKWFADLGSDSLAWISKNTSGSDSKVLSQKGNWVNLPSIPSVPTALSELSEDSDHLLVTATEKSTWNNKQTALSGTPVYTGKGTSKKVAKITTNNLGQVTNIVEVDIDFPTYGGMSTDANNADAAAIRNLINKITIESTSIGSDEYFVAVKSGGQWKYTMATLKSYALDGPANSVKDAGATSKNINVRWEGSSVGSNFKHFACFRTKDGGDSNTSATICDIPITEAREQMLGSSIGDSNTPVRLDSNGVFQTCSMSNYVKNNVENAITTSGKIGLTCQDDVDARIRAMETDHGTRYIQLDVESAAEGGNVAVYGRNGQSNGSYMLSIDASTVNSGGRGVCGLGHSTDTLVRLGNKKLDFSGTFGAASNTIYFI